MIGAGPDYPYGQCTWGVAHAMLDRTGSSFWFFARPNNLVRDANVWHEQPGVRVLDAPKIGNPVEITGGVFSAHGHVAIVEKVEGTRIYVSQWNYPNALAYSEQWYDTTDGLTYRFLEEAKSPLPGDAKAELSAYLSSKGSPYANVDIISSCDAAGISRNQCRLLVAICGYESRHGTRYAVDYGPQSFNCGGVKAGSWNKQFTYRPPLVMFPDWPTFWAEYTKGMKSGWFDRGASAPGELCFQYVGKPGVCEQSWKNGVTSIYNSIPDLT